VADAAAVLDATAGPDPLAWYNAPAPRRPFREEVGADPGALRIGVMQQPPLELPYDAACAEAARGAGAALAALGHSVEPVEVPTFAAERGRNFASMIAGQLGNYDGVDWALVEPHIAHARAQAEATSSYEYVKKIGALERESRDVVAHWGRDFDLLVTPTTAILPPLAGQMLEQVHARPERPPLMLVQTVAFTNFANITGLPAITLPLHTSAEGLPVGVQLVGGPWGEAQLLRVAAQLHP
jgi:amidase